MMNRRLFLGSILGTGAALLEEELWVPGKKLISLPPMGVFTKKHLSKSTLFTHHELLEIPLEGVGSIQFCRRGQEIFAEQRNLGFGHRSDTTGRTVDQINSSNELRQYFADQVTFEVGEKIPDFVFSLKTSAPMKFDKKQEVYKFMSLDEMRRI